MNNTISKQSLLERAKSLGQDDSQNWKDKFCILVGEIVAEKFDSPSNQGEAARLREALEEIKDTILDVNKHPSDRLVEISKITHKAISTHTEDTGIQKVLELIFANDDQRKIGWTLSPVLLDEIQNEIGEHEDAPSWEGIELVLLAYHGITIPGITDGGKSQ
ncbi:hypothetical protein [Cohnella sp. GCM10027633]|uniref:hypothetical protein n=1 Tax=unclassified Cohnella TaxID=2636738 RepID=UPI0036442D56